MRIVFRLLLCSAVLLTTFSAVSQNRIQYNHQQLYLSGVNLAWIDFANDIGPGVTDFVGFGNTLLQLHDHGGNALRWWLHTSGTSTPQFNGAGVVVGPGAGTIKDIKQALAIAWEREIGVILCLWSFDMLRSSNSATVLNRNILLLTDTAYTNAYIRTCLIPMVDSLKGHPAIIDWEIFNEPEGMSNEFGWPDIQHVSMLDIQRFINLCAGAIHRTDSAAQVSNGSWSFYALTDVPTAPLGKAGAELSQLTDSEKRNMEMRFAEKYRMSLTADEIIAHMDQAAAVAGYNYYTDSRLIATGGDPDGTMDFYTVHYYDWGGTAISPFHHPKDFWGLDKDLVVGEFAIQNTLGIPKTALYENLYQSGYAGALAWSWTDVNLSSHADVLASLQFMWDNHRQDVDLLGIAGSWPTVSIISPAGDTTYVDTSAIHVVAAAADTDGMIVSVQFFADTSLIGTSTIEPYETVWVNAPSGLYTISAVATDNEGHQRTSNAVRITVGSPPMKRIEAEDAVFTGQNITIREDATASGGEYVDMATQSGTVTWQIHNVPAAGTYQIAFGYKLFYGRPKNQYININGARSAEVVFDGAASAWLEEPVSVELLQGDNTIQIELSWGWMYLDYLAVPAMFFDTANPGGVGLPRVVGLSQNYPNPFNPSTSIRYQIPATMRVRLSVYDIPGRLIRILVDELKPAGFYEESFDATHLASGVYLYQLTAGNALLSKKMVLVK